MKLIIILLMITFSVLGVYQNSIKLARDYYLFKGVKYVCYFSCDSQFNNKEVVKEFIQVNIRTSVMRIDGNTNIKMEDSLHQWNVAVGMLLDGLCYHFTSVLEQASKKKFFDAMHVWLVLATDNNNSTEFVKEHFQNLNLSIDADLAVVSYNESGYTLTDVFNFGKIQGNSLEISSLGSWRPDNGLDVALNGFKYYYRWDFHNLTLRAISVILDRPELFHPDMLSDEGYTAGIAAMTKITSQLLNLLKEQHNFRFRYTVADRWIGSPQRNSTLAVTNSLCWGEQDISSTCARIFPLWLNWVDICFPPTTVLQTKFYYLMADKGVGNYENRFLTPMSLGVWWCTLAACGLCTMVLAIAAWLESRPKPGIYAIFSVSAALFQQGRKLTLLVVGLTSMLLYNYYTSSVVSWLLSAAAPSIDSLDQLMESDLELIFEDIGYTRGWLDNPGFFYYSGFTNPKEDQLREIKVTKGKRTVKPLQPLAAGVELMRTGSYAYHTEPYTASQVISKTFQEAELCELGSLQMMLPAPVYIMVQKRSPYKEFFIWSLMRLSERGHFQASRRRFAAAMPGCSGIKPRALALGQAAPAFVILLQLTILSVVILIAEMWWHRLRACPTIFLRECTHLDRGDHCRAQALAVWVKDPFPEQIIHPTGVKSPSADSAARQ